MKRIFRSIRKNIYLILLFTLIAILFSELLVYLQINLFWKNEDHKMAYYLGLFTPLIDSFILIIILLYFKAIQTKKLKLIIKKKNMELDKKYKELEELNKNLENNIKKEIEKNRDQQIKLLEQSKMASLGEMIGNIAHQWRQPLSIITANASGIRLKKDFNSLDDNFLDKSLISINESAQYLSNTIDIFRNFTKEHKEFKEVILQDRINIALNIVKASLENNHIKLINNIDYEHDIKISLVVGELSETIINILNNAKDVLLERKIKNAWIKIEHKICDKKVIITIEDNGGGIDKKIINKIFEPYFTTKHSSQGTGLGLHISYDIIRNSLKGDLYVKNSEYGAKFFIELPL